MLRLFLFYNNRGETKMKVYVQVVVLFLLLGEVGGRLMPNRIGTKVATRNTSYPDVIQVTGDVVILNILPNGNIGSVGKVTVCEDTKVWGSPRTDVPVVGELKAGEVILSHEIYQDWMMFEPAEWIPLNVVCEFRGN